MKRRRLAGVVLLVAGLVLALALWPTTRRVGTDYVVREERITVGRKAFDLIARHLRTRRLLDQIVAGLSTEQSTSDDARLIAIFEWVIAHVGVQPANLPTIDDHPIDIIERGYGARDQRAEAFALLATYLDHPATLVIVRLPGLPRALYLTVVRVRDRLTVFDVHAAVACREGGLLVDLARLRADAALAARACAGVEPEGHAYAEWLRAIDDSRIDFNRMLSQRPLDRLLFELHLR